MRKPKPPNGPLHVPVPQRRAPMTLEEFLNKCDGKILPPDYTDKLIAIIRKLRRQREIWRQRSNEYNDYLPADVDDQELTEIIEGEFYANRARVATYLKSIAEWKESNDQLRKENEQLRAYNENSMVNKRNIGDIIIENKQLRTELAEAKAGDGPGISSGRIFESVEG